MTRKKLILIGILTYILGLIVFNLFNYLGYVILPTFEDWELFNFNLYGSLIFYGIAMILFLIFSFLIKIKRINNLILLVVLMLFLELPSIVLTGKSIILSIFTTMVKDNNYVLLLYPFAIILTYYISKKITKVKI